jgi:hypothetical protein
MVPLNLSWIKSSQEPLRSGGQPTNKCCFSTQGFIPSCKIEQKNQSDPQTHYYNKVLVNCKGADDNDNILDHRFNVVQAEAGTCTELARFPGSILLTCCAMDVDSWLKNLSPTIICSMSRQMASLPPSVQLRSCGMMKVPLTQNPLCLTLLPNPLSVPPLPIPLSKLSNIIVVEQRKLT